MEMYLDEKKRTLIFINVVFSSIASSMLITPLTTALPAITKDLNISFATGQWLTSGYSLILGVMIPLTAYLMTRFKTKKLYLTGLLLSIVGIVLCIFAPNFAMVMIARGFQACGNGITSSMGQVVILTIYPPEKRGSAMGWYGLSMGAAPAIAPIIAGFIVDTVGWRAVFVLALVAMLVAFVLAQVTFENVLKTELIKFDILSFALSAMTFCGLTLGIGNITTYGLKNIRVLIPLFLGISSGILFSYRQLNMDNPLLELRVFKDRNFTISVIGSMMLYFVMMGLTVLLPLYIQAVCGYSATMSGVVKLPGSIVMSVASLFAGKLYDKFGIRKIFIAGAIFMLVSNISLAALSSTTPLLTVGGINMIYNTAIGCLMMPLVTWGVSKLDNGLTAHGTALMNSLRTVAGSIGTAVLVGIMTSVSENTQQMYGTEAQLYGFKAACLSMAVCTLILLIIAVFQVKQTER